jgi:hypothetical protein
MRNNTVIAIHYSESGVVRRLMVRMVWIGMRLRCRGTTWNKRNKCHSALLLCGKNHWRVASMSEVLGLLRMSTCKSTDSAQLPLPLVADGWLYLPSGDVS